MTGTFLNVAGILIGGAVGLKRRAPLSPSNEAFAKVAVAAFTLFYGLRLTWMNVNGPFMHVLKQVLIIVLALTLGKLTGRLLRLQEISNGIGHWAREVMNSTRPDDPQRAGEGFKICAALFCAAPLGILGALQEGLTSPPYFYPLAVKGVVDGLAALGFVTLFGWGVLLAAVPVLAVQGTITLLSARFLEPFLSARDLVAPVNAVIGMLIFSVSLVMLGLKKIELTNYLPSPLYAPLLTWLIR